MPPMPPLQDKPHLRPDDPEWRRRVSEELEELAEAVDGEPRKNMPGLITMVNTLRDEVLRLQSRVLFLTILVGILMVAVLFLTMGLL